MLTQFLNSPHLPAMFLYSVGFLACARAALAACYDIYGSQITLSDFVTCNSIVGTISMCCATNRGSSSQYTPDTCLPNGLCQNIFVNKTTNKPDTNYWREGCSDRNWSSQYCLGACSSSSEVDSFGNARMTPCDGTASSSKWCCGEHNTACCGTGREILLAAVLGSSSMTSSTSTSSSTSSTSTSQSSSTSTTASISSTSSSSAPQNSQTSIPTQTPASSSVLSTGAKAGIGIGSAAVVVLAAVGAIWCVLKRKKISHADGPPVDYGIGEQEEAKRFPRRY